MRYKILFIHHGGSKGGAPRSLSFLISNLDKTLFEPFIVFPFDKDDNTQLFENAGAKVIYDNSIRAFNGSTVAPVTFKRFVSNLYHAIPTYMHAKKIAQKLKPDLVHINSTCLFMAAKGIKRANKKIPIICHVREPLLNNIWGSILRINVDKYVDELIAIDKYDAKSVYTGKRHINIIYNFVDFTIYNDSIRSRFLRDTFSIPDDGIIFLYLARIAKSNGVYEMLDCLGKYDLSNTKAYFVIAGFDGFDNYSQKIRELCDLYPRVFTLPFSSNVTDIIASCDVMVCPFVVPHFSRAIIEAGAMGKPSIASNIGGPDELVIHGQTGILFDKGDFSTFIAACRLLCTNSELRIEMGRKAAAYAKENFNMEKNAIDTINVYHKHLI